MTNDEVNRTSSLSTFDIERFTLLIDQLNAQLGFCGALMVEQYNEQKKTEFLNEYKSRIPTFEPQDDESSTSEEEDKEQQTLKLSDDLATVANILTQIQYDLFDIICVIGKQTLPQSQSRIDEKSLEWLSDLTEKISKNLPQHQDPLLPVGNKLSISFYLAKNFCQQAHSTFLLTIDKKQDHIYGQYLSKLEQLTSVIFRWVNLISGEREWFWKPRSEIEREKK